MSRTEKDLNLAAQHYEKARVVWTAHGQALTHEIMGACLYKLGCIAHDRGQIDAAV